MKYAFLVVVFVFALVSFFYADEEGSKVEAKIKKVVLYKHGVGYFERSAVVEDDAVISLIFKSEEMKDMLTSFFAIDLAGGRVTTIGYDSKDPIEKQMEGILMRVPDSNTLTAFLTNLKGASVEIKHAGTLTRGKILGIEPVTQKVDGMTITNYKVLVLNDLGVMLPLNLMDVSEFKLLDEPLQRDLKKILEIYLKAKYTNRKEVILKAEGDGKREIKIGYVIETPIWKTSYRLLFEKQEKPLLQGMAIVENNTDSDWENVEITFVAGNPLSFIVDLYTSYYPKRPTIDIGTILPGLVEGAELAKKIATEKSIHKEGRARLKVFEAEDAEYALKGEAKKLSAEYFDEPSLSNLLTHTMEAMTTRQALGEHFAYSVKSPVTIQRGKAALVPILAEKIDCDRVLYLKPSVSHNPFNAAFITNNTDAVFESGTITFFDGSTYIGEGILYKPLKKNMHEIIPFAIETACGVEVNRIYDNRPAHKAKISNGILTVVNYAINETSYKIINNLQKNYTLYIDHPKAVNFRLIEPDKTFEELEGIYRFKIDLAPNKNVEFKVKEQIENSQVVYINNQNVEAIKMYLQQPYLSEKAKTFLKEIVSIMNDIAEKTRKVSSLNNERNSLTEDQARLRNNISVLRNTPKEEEMRTKYLEKLQAIDDRIEKIKDETNSLNKEILERNQSLSKKITEFSE